MAALTLRAHVDVVEEPALPAAAIVRALAGHARQGLVAMVRDAVELLLVALLRPQVRVVTLGTCLVRDWQAHAGRLVAIPRHPTRRIPRRQQRHRAPAPEAFAAVAGEAAFVMTRPARAMVRGRERRRRRGHHRVILLAMQVAGDAEAVVLVLVLDEGHRAAA